MLKTCSKCKIEKDTSLFNRCSKSKDGLNSACKDCSRADGRAYAAKRRLTDAEELNRRNRKWVAKRVAENPNYYRELYAKNPEAGRAKGRKHYANNREKSLNAQKKWRKENPETAKQSAKTWRLNNPERAKELQKIG